MNHIKINGVDIEVGTGVELAASADGPTYPVPNGTYTIGNISLVEPNSSN